MLKEPLNVLHGVRSRKAIDSPYYPDLVLYKVIFLHLNINRQKTRKLHEQKGKESMRIKHCFFYAQQPQ